MEKSKNKYFIAAGVLSSILILSSLMGLAGNFQTGGFSPFIIINAIQALALLFLSIILFMKKDNILLGIALICNSVITLISLCFSFNWQEFLITITSISLTLNYFTKENTKAFKKSNTMSIIFLATLIIMVSILGFINNLSEAIKANDEVIFTSKLFMYYLMPFLYATINCVLFQLLAVIINNDECINKKISIIKFIPLFVVAFTTIVCFIISFSAPRLNLNVNTFSELVLVITGVIAELAIVASPFIFVIKKDH